MRNDKFSDASKGETLTTNLANPTQGLVPTDPFFNLGRDLFLLWAHHVDPFCVPIKGNRFAVHSIATLRILTVPPATQALAVQQ
jgi:hypothetical protein